WSHRRTRRFLRPALAAASVALAVGAALVYGVRTGFAAAQEQGTIQHPEPPSGIGALTRSPGKRALAAVACAATPPTALASAAQGAQQGVPIVELPAAKVVSGETFGGLLGVRGLSSGNVLANDAGRRQLKVLDSALKFVSVGLD